jgi:hypothetical protein
MTDEQTDPNELKDTLSVEILKLLETDKDGVQEAVIKYIRSIQECDLRGLKCTYTSFDACREKLVETVAKIQAEINGGCDIDPRDDLLGENTIRLHRANVPFPNSHIVGECMKLEDTMVTILCKIQRIEMEIDEEILTVNSKFEEAHDDILKYIVDKWKPSLVYRTILGDALIKDRYYEAVKSFENKYDDAVKAYKEFESTSTIDETLRKTHFECNKLIDDISDQKAEWVRLTGEDTHSVEFQIRMHLATERDKEDKSTERDKEDKSTDTEDKCRRDSARRERAVKRAQDANLRMNVFAWLQHDHQTY